MTVLLAALVAARHLVANASLVHAQRHGSVPLVSSLLYAAGVFSTLFGWACFDEVLDDTILLGVALVLAGSAGTTWVEGRQAQRTSTIQPSA